MPPPTVEGWILHGDLQPWVHYVPLRRDYEDLADRVRWLERHPRKAAQIAAAGRSFIQPYGNFTRDRQLAAHILRELLTPPQRA